MGAALESAKEMTTALEAQEWARVRRRLADDFVFLNPYSPMPEVPLDQWLGLNQILANAFSDFTYNFEILEEKGDQAWVASAFEGTHDHDLDLTPLGMGIVPATGKHARANRSISVGTLDADGKLGSIEVIEEPEGSGLMGLLAQIGVDMG